MSDVMKAFEQLMQLAQAGSEVSGRKDPPGVAWDGTKITLPADPSRMGLREAANWLVKAEQSAEKEVMVQESIDAFPWEGAVALQTAIQELYGYADSVDTKGMFGVRIKPQLLSIEVGVGKTMQVLWGACELPGIPGTVATGVDHVRGRMVFQITAQVRQKHAEAIKMLAERTRQIVKERSIYRGHAIKLHTDSDGDLDFNSPPTFMDVSKVRVENLIFSDGLMDQIETNLFTPLKRTEECRKHNIPLKRGVLLAGVYGTGKTLTAAAAAKLCEQNGWTYVHVERATALKAALEFASQYPPAMVFCEDIDREMAGERTAQMDDILNTIDGVESKSKELMVVLTSNAVEKINRAMLRPGRLDAVITITPPDAKAAERLVRLYGGRLIQPSADLSEAGKALDGMIPAVIREAVERAKLSAIAKRPGQPFQLTSADLVTAANTMKGHLALLSEPKDSTTPEHKVGAALLDGINHHLGNGSESGLSRKVSDILSTVQNIEANQ